MILLRSTLFNAYFFGLTFILIWPAMIVWLVARDRVLGFATAWARLVVGGARVLCGIRYQIEGAEHLPRGPGLIASRHQSAFDTLVWMGIVPHPCYVLKRELRAIPLFGALTDAAGMIAVDRGAGANALRGLLRDAEQAVADQRQVVIFPEGTRSEPGTMLPLQPGIAALAARTGLPVIPVATDSGRYWGRRAFRKQPGTIRIVVRPPLPAGLRREELMRRLAEAMAMPDEQPRTPDAARRA